MRKINSSPAIHPLGDATLDDWCRLHHITQQQVTRWLGKQDPPRDTQNSGLTDIDAGQVWHWSADAMAAALPAQRDAIFAARDMADVNTSPDIQRHPTAFTLHDAGQGRPYVSVPYTGSARDVLTLAHEFGHVIQILNTDAHLTPPVLREVCAFLAEGWLLEYLATFDTLLSDKVRAPWARSVAVDFGARRAALLDAFHQGPQTPYDYAWNYPLARRLALEAARTLDPQEQWQLFTGALDVTTLAGQLNL